MLLSLSGGLAGVGWKWREAEGNRLQAEENWWRAEETAEAEARARANTEQARQEEARERRHRTELLSAHMSMERGLVLCEKGEIDRGLLWLARFGNDARGRRGPSDTPPG